jgi:hypothetical protein
MVVADGAKPSQIGTGNTEAAPTPDRAIQRTAGRPGIRPRAKFAKGVPQPGWDARDVREGVKPADGRVLGQPAPGWLWPREGRRRRASHAVNKVGQDRQPPIPSASTWWNTTIRAQASPSRLVTSVADHSGWSGGSGCVTAPAATRRRASSSPGGGQRISWTCRVMSNSGSSTHTGRPQPGGVDTSRWRKREMPRIRSAGTMLELHHRQHPLSPPRSHHHPGQLHNLPVTSDRARRDTLVAPSQGGQMPDELVILTNGFVQDRMSGAS